MNVIVPTADGTTTPADNEPKPAPVVGRDARTLIRDTVKRIENLEAERSEISEAIRDVYAEAKGNGLSPKILRQVIRLRKMDAADRAEQDTLRRLYCNSLGMKTPGTQE